MSYYASIRVPDISHMYTYVTVLAKTHHVRTKTEFNFLPQFTDTLNIYPSPVYQVLNINCSAFLKGILSTLQSHS